MDETKRKVARILLDIKAVTLNLKQPYRYASGILSPIYCDNRLLMSYPEKREIIRDFYIKAIEENDIDFDVIAGVATSGIPHAAWIAQKLGKPMIYIRQSEKGHGKQNLIEGKLEKGRKVIVIEDLFSTGGSSVSAVMGARSEGAVVESCIGIFTYQLDRCSKAFEEARCKMIALCDFSTLIDVASESGNITNEEKEKALEWNKDTQEWGRKMGYE